MRLSASIMAASAALSCSVAARAQPPRVDQIMQALGRPATAFSSASHDPLRITAGMLKGPTRGIIPAMPVQVVDAGPPTGSRPSAQNPCPPGSGQCALSIEFELGSASLTPNATATLDNLGKALASLQDSGFRFRLEGHTDTVGSDSFNLSLSEQRAIAVRTYLSGHFAISPNRLEPIGMGKENPLVPTPDQTPEPRNRRVQVVNIGT
jgi:outer membrane protein OmpA-like peptidoglycan-associated protein